MKITDTAVYLGRNLYAPHAAIRQRLDLGALRDWPVARLGTDFVDDLVGLLPVLTDASVAGAATIARWRGDEACRLGAVMERVAIALQVMTGAELSLGVTLPTAEDGLCDVVYDYETEPVGLAAGVMALALLNHLVPQDQLAPDERNPDFDPAATLDAYLQFAEGEVPGFSVRALAREAKRRGIPVLRSAHPNRIRLGFGHRQHDIHASNTDLDSPALAELVSDKAKTIARLSEGGLPVPQQRVVQRADAAVAAAEALGYPVVVKPIRGDGGRGVSVKLTDPDAVAAAFERARELESEVIVETYIEGSDHRMLVIDGVLFAVSQRVPGHVVGDGKSSVEQLIAQANRDPSRGRGHQSALSLLLFDDEARQMLARRGYDGDTVPAAGETVALRRVANLAQGGIAIDMTDRVHPDNRALAEQAAAALTLRVAGVDFLTPDITQSYKAVGGAICEVNDSPGLRLHQAPSEGTPRDVAGRLVDLMFPPGRPSRIPIAAITGTNGKTTTTRMVAQVLRQAGYTVGLTSTNNAYVGDDLIVEGDVAGAQAARKILKDPRVEAAVLETARGGLIEDGIGYEQCNVGVVLRVQNDHIGHRGIMTLDDMARVKRMVVETATDMAVLNADDLRCLGMARHTEAARLCLVTEAESNPAVDAHVANGGTALRLEAAADGPALVLYDAGERIAVLHAKEIPATLGGLARHNTNNAMFAAAAAYGLGLTVAQIRDGLRGFECSFEMSAGRMNFCDKLPFKVLLDWAHNAFALDAMMPLLDALQTGGRRICTLSAPGNRDDRHYADMARIAAGKFDHYVLFSWPDLRGREPVEVPGLLRQGLIDHGVDPARITIIRDEEQAVDIALRMGRPEDFVVLFIYRTQGTWDQVNAFEPEPARVE